MKNQKEIKSFKDILLQLFKRIYIYHTITGILRDPMVKICFHCSGPGFNSCGGTKILGDGQCVLPSENGYLTTVSLKKELN